MVLSRLFGKKDPFSKLQKAYNEKRWADCLRLSEQAEFSQLEEARADEAARMLDSAGDALCRLNIDEGSACLRAGDLTKAREHFELAQTQARSEEMRHKVEGLLAGVDRDEEPQPAAAAGGCAGGSCGAHAGEALEQDEPQDLDEDSHLELILSSYPAELIERYLGKSAVFRQAFLAAHDGRDQESLDGFDQVDEAERDELYFYERGLVRDRLGDFPGANRDLKKALSLNENHGQSLVSLIALHWRNGDREEVETLAHKGIESGIAAGFCLGRMAALRWSQERLEEALEFGRRAMSQGAVDLETALVTAAALEKTGKLDEAENVLAATGTSGCGGGRQASPYLAEFWLRHGRNLDKAIDAFNHAARGEPGNPRWIFRVGEAYLAKGWKKEGQALLERALLQPSLDPQLAAQGKKYLRHD
jgi:tetratricopeptide (TPR) repeat protein